MGLRVREPEEAMERGRESEREEMASDLVRRLGFQRVSPISLAARRPSNLRVFVCVRAPLCTLPFVCNPMGFSYEILCNLERLQRR